MSTQDDATQVQKALNQVQKFIVLGSTIILFLLVLGLFFLQQMTVAQGLGADGFYQIFGSANIAGLMLAIPVSVGLGLQVWRLILYKQKILSGQFWDYVVTTLLILVSVGVELYVFNFAPRMGIEISQNLPRIVISAYLIAHVGQVLVEVWTDRVAEIEAEAKTQTQQTAPSRSSNHHRKFRTEETQEETRRETVRPKR